MKILRNVKEGPVTTIIGILIILASVASVFVPHADTGWPQAVIGIACGLSCMGMSDRIFQTGLGNTFRDNGGNAAIIFLISAAAFAACIRRPAPTYTNEKTDSTWIKEKVIPKDTTLPGDSAKVKATMPCPTAAIDKQIAGPLKQGIKSKGKNIATAKLSLNDKNQLECECDCAPWVVKLLHKEREVNSLRKLLRVVHHPPEKIKYTPWYAELSIWWTVISLLLLVLFLGFKLLQNYIPWLRPLKSFN